MTRSLLLLLLLGACVRDLEVPPEPAAAPEALGELSGIYTLAFEWLPPGATAPIEVLHGSLMAIVHLEKPGDELEPVAGFVIDSVVDLDPTLPTEPEGDPLQFFSRSFYAAYDGEKLLGRAERFLPVEGVRAPGGGALLMDMPGLGICPRDRATEGEALVRARRVCAFDPATSGVYRGEAGSCDGGATGDTYLGIGFFDDAALAMRYPEEAELAVLAYDRFRGQGTGATLSQQALQATSLVLQNEEDRLRLQMDVFDPSGACIEHRSLTRFAGGDSTSACGLLPVPTGDLEYEARVTVEGGERRYVDFRVVDVRYPTAVFPAGLAGFDVALQATDGGMVRRVPDAEVPAGISARFLVQDPAPRPGEPTRLYEAVVARFLTSGEGVVYQVAPLRCLRDRVGG